MQAVTNISKQEIHDVIKIMEPIIEDLGSCGVNYGVRTKFSCGKSDMQEHVIDKVVSTMLKDGRYLAEKRERNIHGHDFNISKNPNYELNENIKATNISTQNLNVSLKKSNKIMAIIAALTGLFIAAQFLLLLIISPKDPYKLLNKIVLQLDSLKQIHREIDSSISKAVRDSLYASPHR